MKLHEKQELSKIIITYALDKHKKIFTACSFGKDSIVVMDLVRQIDPDSVFIGIDTGYEFPETLQFADDIISDLNLNFIWARPSEDDVFEINKKYGDEFVLDGQPKCCAMKIPAIEKHLPNYQAWLTGLRRDETEERKNMAIIESGKIDKVNPIAFWTQEDVWQYIKEKGLRYHPLYDQGFKSLGCKPCTTQGEVRSGGGRQGQFERAGRFNFVDCESME